ncbi:MAG: hypothetical protein L0Y36_07080, partial [Planctomycetales bacterium]|nr:hypothetical protein [Planctomycetales bacterium]
RLMVSSAQQIQELKTKRVAMSETGCFVILSSANAVKSIVSGKEYGTQQSPFPDSDFSSVEKLLYDGILTD